MIEYMTGLPKSSGNECAGHLPPAACGFQQDVGNGSRTASGRRAACGAGVSVGPPGAGAGNHAGRCDV